LEEHQTHSYLSSFINWHLPTIDVKCNLKLDCIPNTRVEEVLMLRRRKFIPICTLRSDFVPFFHDPFIGGGMLADLGKCLETFLVSTLLAKPPRGIRNEKDPGTHKHSRDQLDQEWKTPGPKARDIPRSISDVEGNHDTGDDAKLLEH
jgi:hypothetical protein